MKLRCAWIALAGGGLLLANWPQAAGPDGNWRVRAGNAPVEWSVSLDKNIVWRTPLPNGGQSGIAVWGDRLFLTTFDEYHEGDPKFSASILGHCLDARTGKLLWSVKLEGSVKSPMMYAYSDSTSPTPATDGTRVFFFNSSGEMGAWDFQGKEIWRRNYTPWGEPYPFNKQHEPILFGDTVLNVEPLDGNPPEKRGWNYLRGIDKRTGKTLWVAEDGTTTYTTSVFGKLASGKPAVLTARGGWHDVPERPVGLSLLSLAPGEAGHSLWRWVAPTDQNGKPLAEPGSLAAPTWQALYTMHWDQRYAYWFKLNPEESHLVFDSNTGRLLREQSLIRNVDYRQWDPSRGAYIVHQGVNLREMTELSPRNKLAPGEVIRVMPAWHANIAIDGYHYFLTTVGHRRNNVPPKGRAGPSHCIARVNVETGKVEYLEVPVTVVRKPGVPEKRVYGVAVATSTLNSRGQDVGAEDRSRTDGWEIPAFWGSPIAINDNVYFTTMPGITYVVNAKAKVLDESAIVAINDLGPSGETWTLNTPSFSDGRIYHRTLKEVIAIGPKASMTIDAHHHLWKYSAAEYGWISPEMKVIRRDFLPEDLEAVMHHFGIEGTVAVQARGTLEETTWLLGLAEKHPLIRGVVGWVPLTEGAGVKRSLERFAGNPKLRGVRHVVQDEPDPRYILRKDFNEGVSALREFGLRYDILIFERHLPAAIEFVDRHPNQTFILDHVAKPRIKDRILAPWDRNMRELAKRQNVYCKLSGMVTEANPQHWTPQDLQPYIDVALAAFGPRRLMYGSDWPVMLLAGDYVRWYGTVTNAIAKLSKTERDRIMGGTAAEAYGI